jgi:hypothetical protein
MSIVSGGDRIDERAPASPQRPHREASESVRTTERTVGIALALAVLGLGLACTSGPATPQAKGNRAACHRYAEHLNELSPCVGLTYDPDNWCEGADQLAVDMTAYYDCLLANSACEGTTARLEVGQCTPPLVLLAADQTLGSPQAPTGEGE